MALLDDLDEPGFQEVAHALVGVEEERQLALVGHLVEATKEERCHESERGDNNPERFPNVSFTDPRVKLADMTGDGLQDIALSQDGRVVVEPISTLQLPGPETCCARCILIFWEAEVATVENDVKAGGWQTIFSMWGSGVNVHGVFTRPAGMQIKVRYGAGWFGWDRQKQTLDGINPKTLRVGGTTTYLRVRFQVKVQADSAITWEHIAEGP